MTVRTWVQWQTNNLPVNARRANWPFKGGLCEWMAEGTEMMSLDAGMGLDSATGRWAWLSWPPGWYLPSIKTSNDFLSFQDSFGFHGFTGCPFFVTCHIYNSWTHVLRLRWFLLRLEWLSIEMKCNFLCPPDLWPSWVPILFSEVQFVFGWSWTH